ncbi:major facilitator superfamily domain-containing protein [Trichoderma evansii]
MPFQSAILPQEPGAQSAEANNQHGDGKSNANYVNAIEDSPNNNSINPKPEVKGRQIRGLRWLVICVALYISCILYGLDTTMAADVQVSVIEQFGHIEQLTWVGAGFPLGSLFEVGSALYGTAPTMSALIVGRVIAGVGGSGIYLGSLNHFLAVTAPEERGLYIALIESCWGIGAILGPVIGGAFATSSATWRWATITTLVVFVITLVAYALQQYFALFTTNAHRAFPVHLLCERTQVLLYITTAAGITTLYVAMYFIPVYFQFTNDDSALKAAVRLLPFVIVAISVNLASGGLAMLSGYSIATLTTKPENAGAALSLQNVSQLGGQVIALAVAGQIFHSTAVRNLQSVLSHQNFSEQDIESAVAGVRSKVLEKVDGALRQEVILALVHAMRQVFVLIPAAGGVMILAASCMKREKLFGVAAVAAV